MSKNDVTKCLRCSSEYWNDIAIKYGKVQTDFLRRCLFLGAKQDGFLSDVMFSPKYLKELNLPML